VASGRSTVRGGVGPDVGYDRAAALATITDRCRPTAYEGHMANREQRRREKFGKTGVPTKDDWPQSAPNPVFGTPAEDAAAHTGQPDQDVTHETGPGTGGATEGNDRVVDREGIHGSSSQKQ